MTKFFEKKVLIDKSVLKMVITGFNYYNEDN